MASLRGHLPPDSSTYCASGSSGVDGDTFQQNSHSLLASSEDKISLLDTAMIVDTTLSLEDFGRQHKRL